MGTKIAHWLFVCREVNPSLIRETRQWVAVIGGGLWPMLATGGQNVEDYLLISQGQITRIEER